MLHSDGLLCWSEDLNAGCRGQGDQAELKWALLLIQSPRNEGEKHSIQNPEGLGLMQGCTQKTFMGKQRVCSLMTQKDKKHLFI